MPSWKTIYNKGYNLRHFKYCFKLLQHHCSSSNTSCPLISITWIWREKSQSLLLSFDIHLLEIKTIGLSKKKRYKHNNWHQTLEAGKIFHSLGCEYHGIDITAGLLLLSVSSVCSCHRETLSPGAVHQVLTLSAILNWFRPEQALQMIQ